MGANQKVRLRKDEPSGITRRRFFNCAALTSAGLIVALGNTGAESRTQKNNLVVYPPMKIEGAERLLPGSFLYFEYPQPRDPAVLIRRPEGEYTAYSRRCAHLGCSVEFDNSSRCLSCPCHRGAYDSRTGFVLYGPPPRPLDQIILQMRAGGEVWAVGCRIGSSNYDA